MILNFLLDSIPYIWLFILTLMTIYFKHIKWVLVLNFFLLFLFSALRYDVGWDYMQYYDGIIYNLSYVDKFEYIERQLIYLSRNIGYPQLFFIINSFFTILFVTLAISKLSKFHALSFIIFLCFPLFFLHSLSTVRFHLALAIMLWAYVFIVKRQYLIFLLILGCACFIHASAFISILYLLPSMFAIGKKLNIIIFCSSFLISPLLFYLVTYLPDGLIVDRFLTYMSKDHGESFNIFPIIIIAINIFNLLIFYYAKNIDTEIAKYLTIYNIGCFFMIAFSFQETLATRFSRYFILFLILIVPYYLFVFKRIKSLVMLQVIFLSFCIYFAQLYLSALSFYTNGSKDQFLPYKLFFI